jgi:hypothetical protein
MHFHGLTTSSNKFKISLFSKFKIVFLRRDFLFKKKVSKYLALSIHHHLTDTKILVILKKDAQIFPI